MALATTTYLVLILAAILLSYGLGTAIYLYRKRHERLYVPEVPLMTGVVLLLPNGVEGRVIGQLEGPLRFDFWGYEMRQTVFETVRDELPPLYEVELEEWEDEVGKADGRRKDDHSAGWFDYQPTASLLIPNAPHPRVQATYLVAMPSPPAPSFPPPSFNPSAFDPSPSPSKAEPHDLELATLTYEIDVPTAASLAPIGTPLFRPTTRTHWVRTGRRRDQVYLI